MIEQSSIWIITILLGIIALFALISFLKGIAKTALALITLGVSGCVAFWGYHHGPSWLSDYLDPPAYSNIILAVVLGTAVFWSFYKMGSFLANPFQNKESKCGFGLPAALLCVPIACCLLYITINRLRTSDQLTTLKVMMNHELSSQAEGMEGIPAQVMHYLEDSQVGKLILDHDPLWQDDHMKLAKLAIIYHQAGPDALLDNPEATAIFTDPTFIETIVNNDTIEQSIENQQPSDLIQAESLKKAAQNPQLKELLTKLTLNKFG